MHFHIKKVEDIAGFSASNALPGEYCFFHVSGSLTSDEPMFYKYVEQICSIYLTKTETPVFIDSIHRFLIVIHSDLSADIYINDFGILISFRTKKSMKKGQIISVNNIADIERVKFHDIEINRLDRIIYCAKVGWRFGLYFDLMSRVTKGEIVGSDLDIDGMELSIGDLHRYLSFYQVYCDLESEEDFQKLLDDGWFPFIEILPDDYKLLSEAYRSQFEIASRIDAVVEKFSKERIQQIADKWWSQPVYNDKKEIIQAGINAFMEGDNINCIKNLLSEIEGVLRLIYLSDTGKGKSVGSSDLISHIIGKAKTQRGNNHSLMLPVPFMKYLKNTIFKSFNVESGEVELSRHSGAHGVAKPEQYTRTRALQLILVLDQIYFFSTIR